MRKAASAFVSFSIWAAIFVGEAALRVPYFWIMVTTFFVGLPVSGWMARKVTGVDPYEWIFS